LKYLAGRLNFITAEIKNLELLKAKASSTEQGKISTKITNRNKFKKETEALVASLKVYLTSLNSQEVKEKAVREKAAQKKKMVDAQNKAVMFKGKYEAKGKEIASLKAKLAATKSARTKGMLSAAIAKAEANYKGLKGIVEAADKQKAA